MLQDKRIDSAHLLDTTRRLITEGRGGRTDWVSIVCILMLCVTGLFFIYSAHAYSGANFWIKQIIWIFLGSAVYTVVARIDYKIYMENALWFWLAAVFMLLMIWSPLGLTREGATRWLNFGLLAYQPSEAAKVCTLIMVSSVLARSEVGTIGQSVLALVKVLIVTVIPMVLIFLQPDLGSCLVIPPMVLALLYVSRLSKRFFIAVFALAVVFLSVVSVDLYNYSQFLRENEMTAVDARGEYEKESFFFLLRDYQRERIMTFVAPEVVDPGGTGAAWNSKQAQQAVGTGGLWGKGWRDGLQAMLGYLPRSVAHNDFIFAVLAEETGFIGGLFVIGVFTVLLANGIRVAGIARDRFGMLLAVGVTVIFLIHFFVNIGMSIGLTPITGLPLPFLSYGGSFILSCSILMGIVQSVHRHRREFQ